MVAPAGPVSAGEVKGPDYREPTLATAAQVGDDMAVAADEALDNFELRELRVGAEWHGQRLDKALVKLAPEFSRNHLQSLIERGHARVDAQPASLAARKLRAGQLVQLELVPTEESRAFVAMPMALDIVFEDAHLMVLDKPAGLVVHPAPGHWSGTLLNGLLAHHSAAASLPRAGIVHRLDKDTTGVMVVGKTLAAVTALSRAIAAREVHRYYLALAQGEIVDDWQSIDAPIARDPALRIRMAVVASGKPARTDVQCLARRGGYSALGCTLHSGRTHQIRVHLAYRRHPLVSDPLYGGAIGLGLQRQGLHATRLRLQHPSDGRWLDFECAAPPDFAHAWAQVVKS